MGPRQASKISPDHECFHQRGIVYHKTHDYRNGLADFRKARSSHKDTGFRNLHGSSILLVRFFKRVGAPRGLRK